jgi:hypothetical protein
MPTKLSVIAISVLCAALPAFAAKQRVDLVTTDHADFAAGGLIHVEGSTGELNIAGWDQPTVQVITTRYTFVEDRNKEKANERLKRVESLKMTSANGELTISATHKRDTWVHVDYQIMVPRNSRLAIHHRIGDVVVTNVVGDIDATEHFGDIVVQLPEPEHYAIDAKCKIGTVYSDFNDPTRHFAGERLVRDSVASADPETTDAKAAGAKSPALKINLRVGTGGITIQKLDPVAFPSGTAPVAGL